MTLTTTRSPHRHTNNRLADYSRLFAPLAEPFGYEAGDANLFRYVGNSPTNATDPSGLEKLGTLADIQALHDESQKIVDRIRKNNPNDLRLMFLDAQQTILGDLAKGGCPGANAQEVDWLARVLRRFMGSLNNALNGQIMPGNDPVTGKPMKNPKTGKPYTPAEIRQAWKDFEAGKVGGPWWSTALNSAMNANKVTAGSGLIPGVHVAPNAKEAAATIMATAHIHFDLQAALLFEGVGTDRLWKCIGEVVDKAGKKHGRWLTNVFNSVMPRFSNTGKVDPQIMRNDMRDAVIRYFEKLEQGGLFKNDDPFKGLAGTNNLPWYGPRLPK